MRTISVAAKYLRGSGREEKFQVSGPWATFSKSRVFSWPTGDSAAGKRVGTASSYSHAPPPPLSFYRGGSSEASTVLPWGTWQSGWGNETGAREAIGTNMGGGDHSHHRFQEKEMPAWALWRVWIAVMSWGWWRSEELNLTGQRGHRLPPQQSQLEATCWGPTAEQRERGLFLSNRDLRLGSTRQRSTVEGFKQEGFGRNRIYKTGWKRMRGFPEAAFLYFRVTLGWNYPPLSWVQAAFCGDRTSCVFLFYTLTCFPHTYFANSTCSEMGTDCAGPVRLGPLPLPRELPV